MGKPKRGRWESLNTREVKGEFRYERWYNGYEYEHHVHFESGKIMVFRHDTECSVELLYPTKAHICKKCGMNIPMPHWDDFSPLYKMFDKAKRAILKHAWECHREDFPPQCTSLTKFLRWLTTPEGKEWNETQGLLAQAESIVRGEG